jgi:hypothetical protein
MPVRVLGMLRTHAKVWASLSSIHFPTFISNLQWKYGYLNDRQQVINLTVATHRRSEYLVIPPKIIFLLLATNSYFYRLFLLLLVILNLSLTPGRVLFHLSIESSTILSYATSSIALE